MTQKTKKYIADIDNSIAAVYLHIGDMSFEAFSKNLTVKRAVERELEIIGEAVNRILKENPKVEISNARKIVDLRNYIIHGYDTVDYETLWAVVKRHIPILKNEIRKIF
jgi:uncharacterized protein with HEPN domain